MLLFCCNIATSVIVFSWHHYDYGMKTCVAGMLIIMNNTYENTGNLLASVLQLNIIQQLCCSYRSILTNIN